MRERSERVESRDTYVTERVSFGHFCLALCSFGPTALPCSGGYHMERGGMPLLDAVGINCKTRELLKIKVQMSSIWAKGCMFDDCVCVI